MELEQMYKGIAFSPFTSLSRTVGTSDTIIYVEDEAVFPDAPNIATIGSDEQSETIIYSNKAEGQLSGCTRAVEGTAKEWQTGEIIGRNFTNKDYDTLISNILKLNKDKWETPESKTENNFVVFDAEGKPKDSGKNASSFDESGAAQNVKDKLTEHTGNNKIHITDEERQKWNEAATDKHTHSNKSVLDGITQEKVSNWDNSVEDLKNKADKTDLPNKVVNFTLSSSAWQQDSEGIYKQQLSNENFKSEMKLNISFTTKEMVKTLMDAGVTALIIENDTGVVNVFLYGEKPAIEIPIQVELVDIKEVS